MDTGTHIAMGIALGGLATIDPVVRQDPTLAQTIMIGTIVGSHAPDFDTILKLRNNAVYIRHHRGVTHSIPAVILWGLLISGAIYFFVPSVSFLHLWIWTFLAVFLHVFVDIFNAYGTQAYRPFTNRWVAYGFINTFDPFIFIMHAIGIIIWLFGADPITTWLVIYTILIAYYIKRYLQKKALIKKIHHYYGKVERIATSPTLRQNIWRLAITTENSFYVARAIDGNIQIVDRYHRVPLPNNKLIDKAKQDKNVAAFLSFSPVYRWEINLYDDYTEVRFIDLRYRSKGHYPFVAVVQLDTELENISSYTGWVFSEKKLQDKLLVDDEPTLS